MGKLTQKIKRKLVREFNLSVLLWLKGREFKNDGNNKLSMVVEGLRNRSNSQINDSDLLSRISDAYNRAKTAQSGAADCFQVSNEWVPIYEKPLQEVMQALKTKDIKALHRIYGNFYRDSCSTGLVGLPGGYLNGTISARKKKWYLYDSLHRYNLWKSMIGVNNSTAELKTPCIGNPYGYVIDGTFISTGSDYLHYYASAIGRLLRGRKPRVVLELGGGYGGMAYFLNRDTSGLTYIDFDLPENLALTAYYLLNAFPEKKILLYGEADLNMETLQTYDIILMPNFEMPRMPDNSADVVFNSYSLAEMSAEAIHAYIGEFTRIVTGYFLHINHNKVSAVVADDFGIDPNHFDLLYKIPALWNGGRNLDMDEYEYLYKKIS
jgi:putative sugar O-methyltransferase